jgi:hypothetical protein
MDVCVCVLLPGSVRFAKGLNTTISTKYAKTFSAGRERVAKGPRQGSFVEK